ncbi:MAG TPA: MarR family transcriptional regulator [Jatrophihabitans sp.]
MVDHVSEILAQWAAERPDLDAQPMAVFGRLSRAARRVDAELAANFARHDLDAASFDVLATLRRSGKPFALTPKQLGESAMITTGAVTQRLDKLEQRGLVRRTRRSEDGRGVLVQLTASGRRAVDSTLPDHLDTERRLLQALTPRQQADLARLLQILLAGLEHTDPFEGRS